MTTQHRLQQGTAAWFEMVGAMMVEAASRAGLPADLPLSLVERYVDGVELSPGLRQGIRFDIRDGAPSFVVIQQAPEDFAAMPAFPKFLD